MEQLADLKAILHSKRANIYYLGKCRVMRKDGRVLYLTEAKDENLYWNIPIANTTVILLDTGTSITQAAMRMLTSAGVLVGFCGGEIEWLTPQSEYHPTEYIQGWLKFWFDDGQRLAVAKAFQQARVEFIRKVWSKDRELQAENIFADDSAIAAALYGYLGNIPRQPPGPHCSDSWTCWAAWPNQDIGAAFSMYSLSNNHIVTDNDDLKAKLMQAEPGDLIRFTGVLAEYTNHAIGYTRGTSTTRNDTGQGACETVYIDTFEIVKKANPGLRKLAKTFNWLTLLSFMGFIVFFLIAPARPRY